MTGNLKFYDAAFPPSPAPAGFDGVAFYIGGDTPHVWTLAEIESQPVRFRLPIFVRSDPAQVNAPQDVAAALAHLKLIGAPMGALVALDSETSVDPNYVAQFYYGLRNGGYTLIDYGSVSSVFGNHNPDGYYWGAHWTNVDHFEPGTQMTQWEALGAYDESTALPTLPFWDTQIPVNPSSNSGGTVTVNVTMPVLAKGAGMPPKSANNDVRTIQGLLVARGYGVGSSGVDGRFGQDTDNAVVAFQESHHRTNPAFLVDGIVGAQTWPALLGR